MRVHICPSQGPSGFGKVIEAQIRHLPLYGWEIAQNEREADIICVHSGEIVETKKPIVQVCHGYFWSDHSWSPRAIEYNELIIEASRRASLIITPSEWIAVPIRRDLRKKVIVIRHGIELQQFSVVQPSAIEQYVLWGKPRVDNVCDPSPVNKLAELARGVEFITTFGKQADNVKVIGCLEYEKFQDVLKRALVWLATTRETGDIASREAMAYGVPVLGWRFGATAELVTHGVNGYLAEVGNYDDLLAGLRFCIKNRSELSQNARKTAEQLDWQHIMAEYARVFDEVYKMEQYPVQVSIVVPAYNYGRYLSECLDSVLSQRDDVACEVIVVDDGSTDETPEVLNKYGEAVTVVRQENAGLPAALNVGHKHARGKYIINLDADNVLCPGALKTLHNAMENNPHIDVGTGPYQIMGRTELIGKSEIDVLAQFNHHNQVPSTCIMRALAIGRLGGYRIRQRKNEDAEFWCRAMSAGLRFKRVTDDPVFLYRWHGKNKSIIQGGEDKENTPNAWNFYYPWRSEKQLPFGVVYSKAKLVPSYHDPHIAVIIPCGPGHEMYLVDALDSVSGQTFRNIECIVANDTGKPLDVEAIGHPWVRVVDLKGGEGPAAARNAAIAAARAPLIVPLDADDMLYPNTLELFYRAWLKNKDCLVYADCDIEDFPGGKLTRYKCDRFSIDRIKREAIYQDTILFVRQWWQAVGGYEHMPFEDWLFGIKLHLAGVGAIYLQCPWGIYRHWTTLAGGKSKNQIDNTGRNSQEFKEKITRIYSWIKTKEREMGCRNCRETASGTNTSPVLTLNKEVAELVQKGIPVRVICISQTDGARSLNSRVKPGHKYRYSKGSILELLPGDEWVTRHAEFKLFKDETLVATSELTLPIIQQENIDTAPKPNQRRRKKEGLK